jgi:hypothetical protein
MPLLLAIFLVVGFDPAPQGPLAGRGQEDPRPTRLLENGRVIERFWDQEACIRVKKPGMICLTVK